MSDPTDSHSAPEPDPSPGPRPAAPGEEVLKRYLLDDTDGEEREHVERHLVAEPEGLERIEAVERELLDAAARGELSADEHARVVGLLASTPAGRARLAFARDLVEIADGNSETHPGIVPERSLRPPAPRRTPRVGRPWARRAGLAAGVAVAAVAGWLAVHAGHLSEAPPRTAWQRPAALDRHAAASAAGTALLELSLATTRGGGALPRLRLAPGIRRVDLRLDLGGGDGGLYRGYRTYRALVHGAGGRTVADLRHLFPRPTAGGARLDLDLAAAALTPGRYALALQGEREGGQAEEIGFQEFAVSP